MLRAHKTAEWRRDECPMDDRSVVDTGYWTLTDRERPLIYCVRRWDSWRTDCHTSEWQHALSISEGPIHTIIRAVIIQLPRTPAFMHTSAPMHIGHLLERPVNECCRVFIRGTLQNTKYCLRRISTAHHAWFVLV